MNDLLARAVAAHGGLEGFNRFKTVCAHLAIGGALWLLKGQSARRFRWSRPGNPVG